MSVDDKLWPWIADMALRLDDARGGGAASEWAFTTLRRPNGARRWRTTSSAHTGSSWRRSSGSSPRRRSPTWRTAAARR